MDLDLTCQTQIYLGLYEREVYRWLERFSPQVKSALDIGVHDGLYTLYFLARTPAQRVLAYEPDTISHPRLERNLDLSGFSDDPRLKLTSKYVGACDDETRCTLDSSLPEIATPCVIKMDVDGGEVDILRGATRLLALDGVRWIIETHAQSLEVECERILRDAGYRTRIVPNAWWRVFVPELRVSAWSSWNRWLVAARATDVRW
jgi:hypothetical protein